MDSDQLLASIRADLADCDRQTELRDEREKALKYYLGEKYGNEVEGRSSIVTTEVADTVESMLPQILKPFISHENVVYFDPVEPGDEQQAKQETAYLNHVFYKENDGARVLYSFAKDGLLSKNGFVKYYWDESEEVTTESYSGLDDMALDKLLSDDAVEVTEQSMEMVLSVDPATGVELPTPTYNITIKRTEKTGKLVVVNVPPEEIKISAEWSDIDLKHVPFIAHERDVFISDLIAMGYSEDEVRDVGTNVADDVSSERVARFIDTAELHNSSESTEDWSMRKVRYAECYKRVDYDGDGYAELRKICLINGTEILDNEEIDYVPFESWTPVPMPHRFFGRSAADQTMDIQLQKTMLVRNIMDNLYQSNNVRYAVVDSEVAIEDLLDSTPGGVVRMTAPGMVAPLPTPMLTGHPYQMLEYLDTVKENRTGVTRYNQGIDADSLNKTAAGITRIMDASAQRLQMVATLFGEAVRRLMIGMHRLLIQNQDKPKMIRITGQWIPMSPSDWRERSNMTVVVGLGTGDKDKEIQYLMNILSLQKEALMGGLPLVTMDHIYNTAAKIVEASNLREPSQFFKDPQGQPPPQKEDPQQKMVEAQVQVAQQQNQVKSEENQQDYDIQLRKLALEERKVQIEERRLALEELKIVREADKEATQAEYDATHAEMEAINSAQI